MRAYLGELFQQKKYAEAAAMLERVLDRFPDNVRANTFNLAAARALMGQPDKAIDALEDGLRRGAFYSRWDFDGAAMAPVKQHPRFAAFFQANLDRIAEADKKAAMKLEVATPAGYDPARRYPLFVALHGGGENIAMLKPNWVSPRLQAEFIVAYVQSSQVAEHDRLPLAGRGPHASRSPGGLRRGRRQVPGGSRPGHRRRVLVRRIRVARDRVPPDAAGARIRRALPGGPGHRHRRRHQGGRQARAARIAADDRARSARPGAARTRRSLEEAGARRRVRRDAEYRTLVPEGLRAAAGSGLERILAPLPPRAPGWSRMASGTTNNLTGLWGASPTDIFAVGPKGTILHFDGRNWSPMEVQGSPHLLSIWGSSNRDVFVVGDDGVVVHYDGQAWTPMSSGTKKNLIAVWGASSRDVFAAGYGGTVLHYDGVRWTPMATGTTEDLYGIWGTCRPRHRGRRHADAVAGQGAGPALRRQDLVAGGDSPFAVPLRRMGLFRERCLRGRPHSRNPALRRQGVEPRWPPTPRQLRESPTS